DVGHRHRRPGHCRARLIGQDAGDVSRADLGVDRTRAHAHAPPDDDATPRRMPPPPLLLKRITVLRVESPFKSTETNWNRHGTPHRTRSGPSPRRELLDAQAVDSSRRSAHVAHLWWASPHRGSRDRSPPRAPASGATRATP